MNPRVIAGTAKGTQLQVPIDTRPVTDRIKQSLFDTLGDILKTKNIADLYAGSGAFGIEALSRGAAKCLFVDIESDVIEVIKQNLIKTQLLSQSELQRQSINSFLKNSKLKFDIIFADPPFDRMDEFDLHKFMRIMNADSLLVLKLPTDYRFRELKALPIIFQQKYGKNKIIILGKSSAV